MLGHSVAPVGDVGTCTGIPTPAGFCPAADVSGIPDGKPNVLISAFRVDYPLDSPDLEGFRSPTPAEHRGFATTAAGVGKLVGGTENEILLGEFGNQIDEVVFFDTLTDNPLQTVADPDQQRGSTFGIGVAPLGDINGDGFLHGRTIRLDGTLEAFANEARCQAGQTVEIQRRTGATSRYATIASVLTAADCGFASSAPATRSAFFRARVIQDAECHGAASPRKQVEVSPSVRLLTTSARLSARNTLRLRAQCRTDGPCDGTLSLRTFARLAGSRRTLPTATFRAPGSAARTVTVTVRSRTAALLRRSRSRIARVVVVGRDARGNATTVVTRVTIRTR